MWSRATCNAKCNVAQHVALSRRFALAGEALHLRSGRSQATVPRRPTKRTASVTPRPSTSAANGTVLRDAFRVDPDEAGAHGPTVKPRLHREFPQSRAPVRAG